MDNKIDLTKLLSGSSDHKTLPLSEEELREVMAEIRF